MNILTLVSSCASTPERLSIKPILPSDFVSVGFKENYWSLLFDENATLSIHKDKIKLHDEDIDMTISFKNIISIEYDKLFLLT